MLSYLLQHATGAIPVANAHYGRGTGAILLDYVSCTGNEQFLANCTNNGVGITSCGHYNGAGVKCPGNIILMATHRLVLSVKPLLSGEHENRGCQ